MRVGELVAAGRTSDVFEYGDAAVVKVLRPEVPATWAALEADLARAVSARGVRTPAVIDVVEIDGRPSIVFERIRGTTMWSHMRDSPDSIVELTSMMADTHRRIFEAGPPEGVEGMLERTRRKISVVEQLTAEEREEAATLLEELPAGAALLHGDLHPGNVLMTSDGPVVIDWFDASVGHPASDVLRSSLLLRGSTGLPPAHLPGADADTLATIHDTYVAAMSDFLGPVSGLLRRWEAVKAASRLSEGRHPDERDLLAIWNDREAGPAGRVHRALRA